MASWLVFAIIIGGLLVLSLLFILLRYLGLFLQALFSHAHISIFAIIGMHLRKTDIREIVITHIRLKRAGFNVPVDYLDTHWHAGGSPANVATAMITAQEHRKTLRWDEAAKIDLGPDDLLEVVHRRLGIDT